MALYNYSNFKVMTLSLNTHESPYVRVFGAAALISVQQAVL